MLDDIEKVVNIVFLFLSSVYLLRKINENNKDDK